MYVIQRTDQGGGYVSKPGSKNSYTNDLACARAWNTREAAERERCPENERIVPVREIFHPLNW